jgi:hypothetical protein
LDQIKIAWMRQRISARFFYSTEWHPWHQV